MPADSWDGRLPTTLPEETRRSLDCWGESGIGVPYIPEEFAEQTFPLADWSWGWRAPTNLHGRVGGDEPINPMSAYLLHPEYQRFIDGDWRPRFLLCHAGHGANSYCITYIVVNSRIALHAQVSWGGVYTDRARSSAAVVEMGRNVAAVHRAASVVPNWPSGRLLIFDSNIRGRETPAFLAEPGSEPDALHHGGDGMAGALAFIQNLRTD